MIKLSAEDLEVRSDELFDAYMDSYNEKYIRFLEEIFMSCTFLKCCIYRNMTQSDRTARLKINLVHPI